jgi:hypothetical protein
MDERDIKEKSDKEYVKISKEDLLRAYKATGKISSSILDSVNELKKAYKYLVKMEKILEDLLKKGLIQDPSAAEEYIDDLIAAQNYIDRTRHRLIAGNAKFAADINETLGEIISKQVKDDEDED